MRDPGVGPTAAEVQEAARRIGAHLRRTPLERSVALSEALGRDVFLKLENLQRTGSFKVRGALNAVALLTPEERERGVVTASAGNHGLGVALAAGVFGVPATVFLPEDAPALKRDRIARLGAVVRPVAGSYDDAHHEAERFAQERGGHYLHAFSDPAVVAGQGTVGLEIFEALPAVEVVVVPAGGGGLVGGIGVVARAHVPWARVVGVQSAATPALHHSLHAGRLVSPPLVSTLCDGLAGDTDAASLALARRVVDEMLLVEEARIPEAIRWLYREEGVVAEGSGAVAIAALLAGQRFAGRGPVAVVVTGGNIDPGPLARILAE